MGSNTRKPVRIASASGAITDMVENLSELAKNADVDFIVGDWMSEYNMAARGTMKANQDALDPSKTPAFEQHFVNSITPCLSDLVSRGIKVAVNAGASDTERLHDHLKSLVDGQKLNLKIAWVEGDEVLDAVKQCITEGQELRHITTGQTLGEWGYEPVYAQCYLGCWGIVEAFKNGADIVVCGRVADAAPTMAAAAYWHGWSRSDYPELAHSLIAGHLIECSYYVTGGNYTGFKDLPIGNIPLLNMPIARVEASGIFFIESHHSPGRGGEVSVNTCRSQLLYEIQGKRYYNSDVVALVDQVKMEQAGSDSVQVSNIGFEKPPPTTKVGMTAPGGYQAECHYFVVGLDAKQKAALLESQLRHYLKTDDLSLLNFTTSGTSASNPASQDEATADLRIFAQSKTIEALSKENFRDKCWNIVMSTYPGATFAVDDRQAFPKPYNEYFVTMLPQALVRHRTHIPALSFSAVIQAPKDTVPYVCQQEVDDVADPGVPLAYGKTVTCPLGYVVHARSGDKGSDCNVGFYVRHEDEYAWLRSFLSVNRIVELLQNDYNGKRVERFELPHIHAVHFLLKDHLDRGVASSSTYDVLGKNVAEYLRAKHVQVPAKFLSRGRI